MKSFCLQFLSAMLLIITVAGCEGFPIGKIAVIDDPGEVMHVTSETSGEVVPAAAEDPDNTPKSSRTETKAAPESSPRNTGAGLTQGKCQKILPRKTGAPAVEESQCPQVSGIRHGRRRTPEKFSRGPGLWRVFNRLTPEEQKELLELQRKDPERYRAVIQEKVDLLYEKERARQKELDEMAAAYQNSNDPQEKERIKVELRKKLHGDFRRRLQDTRKDIEAHKRKTAHLEAELLKREKNCDAIVDAILQKRLSASSEKTTVPARQPEKK